MSIKIMSRVWSESRVRGNELLMLLAIADFADDNGVAFPSLATLAKKSRVTERPAHRTIASLITRGYLQVERNAGPRGTNVYRVLFPDDERGGVDAGVLNQRGVLLATEGGVVHDQKGVASAPPEPSIEPSIEPSLSRPSPSSPSAPPPKKGRRGATRVPDDFVLTPERLEYARKHGFDNEQAAWLTQDFLDRNAAKGETYVDWERAWQRWIRNATRWSHSVPSRPPAASTGKTGDQPATIPQAPAPTEWGPMIFSSGPWQAHIPAPDTPLSGSSLLRYHQEHGYWFIPGKEDRVYFRDLPAPWLDDLEAAERSYLILQEQVFAEAEDPS